MLPLLDLWTHDDGLVNFDPSLALFRNEMLLIHF